MTEQRLNQVLAIHKEKKQRIADARTKLYQATQKPALMSGFERTFQAKDEDGDTIPSEHAVVQFNAVDVFEEVSKGLRELIDIEGTKDFANCDAVADVIINGATVIEKCPTTHLLFLEKQLKDIETFVNKMAELDPAERWEWEASQGFFRSSRPTITQKTKKMQEALVLHPPTKEHPAQTQMITNDKVVGEWTQIKFSGAIPRTIKRSLLARIETFRGAVKSAREAANNTIVTPKSHGSAVANFIFKDVPKEFATINK